MKNIMTERLEQSQSSQTNQQVDSYMNQDWYKKLTPEKQQEVDKKFEDKQKLEKAIIEVNSELGFKWLTVKIIEVWLNKNKDSLNDPEDIREIQSFEEKMDKMNRDIDILSRQLYNLRLKSNTDKLMGYFKKSNDYFKKWFKIEWEKNKEVLSILNEKDLSTITAWEIYTLRQEWYDLSKLFLIWWKEGISKENMNEWDRFTVNFWWNKSLNRYIWAWDVLPIDKIDKVKINWVEWERKLSPRPWYYTTNWKYLAIFDNYTIEIVSKKDFTADEEKDSLKAFKDRYVDIRRPELLNSFRNQIDNIWDQNSLVLEWFTKNDLEIIFSYLKKYLAKENFENLSFTNNTISTKDWKSLKEVLILPINLWKWYEKYKDKVVDVCKNYERIKPEDLIRLINHENWSWDPLLSAPGSSAYWLWQMIDSTWSKYWGWLDRSNPVYQLEATCKYLDDIMTRKGCDIKKAMAYYNTWEWIMSLSDSRIREYARVNPAIAGLIKWPITPRTYFSAAEEYYST